MAPPATRILWWWWWWWWSHGRSLAYVIGPPILCTPFYEFSENYTRCILSPFSLHARRLTWLHLVRVLCRQPHLLPAPEFHGPVTSRRHRLTPLLPDLCLLSSFPWRCLRLAEGVIQEMSHLWLRWQLFSTLESVVSSNSLKERADRHLPQRRLQQSGHQAMLGYLWISDVGVCRLTSDDGCFWTSPHNTAEGSLCVPVLWCLSFVSVAFYFEKFQIKQKLKNI